MSDISSLKYPNKSHRKIVLLPKKSIKLAEFFGLMMGDGGINNLWQVNITLNFIKDKQYSIYISDLINNLFGIVPVLRKRKNSQALVISLSSTTIVDFLVSEGLVRGNKIRGGLKIPLWILNKKSYRIACVRGLMDTDGGLYTHKHIVKEKEYNNIGLCFTSYSVYLINQVVDIFKENKITPHISNKGRSVYLYKEEAITRYLKIFGTSNDRISKVFNEWRDA